MKHNHSSFQHKMSTRTLASCALLAAMSIALARLAGLMPNAFTRFSIEAVPVFLAGLLFGPMAGGLVGFCADFVGCLFSPFGYNPLLSVPPILYGVFAGLIRRRFSQAPSLFHLVMGFLPPVILGSILYQSFALSYFYYYDPAVAGSFRQGLVYFLSTRSTQFAIVAVIDVLLIYLLFKTRLFHRLNLWPLKTSGKEDPPL